MRCDNMICTKEYNLEIGSKASNMKATVLDLKDLLILKSYNTYVAIYLKSRKALINNIDAYKCSATTTKHYYAFRDSLEVNHKIYVNNQYFNDEIIKKLQDNVYPVGQFEYIFKEYSLEKILIEAIKNYEFNLNENYNFNIGSWTVIDNSKVEIKTRKKEIILCEVELGICQPVVEVTIVTNKSRTKILSTKVKVVSRSGLSFNDYNTKELRAYCY